jgi:hypothetical protein
MPVIAVGRDKLFVALGRTYSAHHIPACIVEFDKFRSPFFGTLTLCSIPR